MVSITVAQIIDRADCLMQVNAEHIYHKSYFYFVNYFSELNKITEKDLIIGSNFTYGWMPTILKFKSTDFELAVEILNKAKRSERIETNDIALLKQLINNSLVGVSKLIHFLNPNIYAIWDTRVCKFLTGKSYQQKVENITRYWSYLDLCERVASDSRFRLIHSKFVEKVGYQVSPMRTIEQIMFISSNEPIA